MTVHLTIKVCGCQHNAQNLGCIALGLCLNSLQRDHEGRLSAGSETGSLPAARQGRVRFQVAAGGPDWQRSPMLSTQALAGQTTTDSEGFIHLPVTAQYHCRYM